MFNFWNTGRDSNKNTGSDKRGRTGQGIHNNIVGVNINYEWAGKGINPRRIKDRYQSIGNYRLRVKMLL